MAKSETVVIRVSAEDREWLEVGAGVRPLSEWARETLVREGRRVYVSAGDEGWIKRVRETMEGKPPRELLEAQILGAVEAYMKTVGAAREHCK